MISSQQIITSRKRKGKIEYTKNELMITEEELNEIENRCNKATKGPWKSMLEGRDHTSGDSFIMTGGEDIYISNPLFDNNLDFIANAKQDIPKLIAEIKRLKKKTE